MPNMFTKRTFGQGPIHGWVWARKGVAPAFSLQNVNKVCLSVCLFCVVCLSLFSFPVSLCFL